MVRLFLNLPTRYRTDDPGRKSPNRSNDAADLLHELSAMLGGSASGEIEERSRDIQIDAEEGQKILLAFALEIGEIALVHICLM